MMDTTGLILDTAQRMFGDHCDKALLDRAEQGHFAARLWDVIAENGLPQLATEAGGGSLADAFRLLRVAGRHGLPLPLAEALIANHLMGATRCGAFDGRVSLGIADSHSAEGAEVNVELIGVPWARSMERICYVIGDPLEIVILEVSDCQITEHANIAGEARDEVRFLGVPQRCGTSPVIGVSGVFELMALSRAAMMSGALERVLDLSLTYAKERKQFGKPIGGFQAIQHSLALLAGQVAAAVRATDAAIAAVGTPRFSVQVSVAKSRVGEAAGIASEIAHQVHGAMGFTHEHQLHHFTRRLLAWRDEYGRESYWQQRIGRQVAAVGADSLWDFVVGS
jgi:acyl-CoA dehydrogenase